MKKIIVFIFIFCIFTTLIFANPSTLIHPPFRHNMGFNKANSAIAKMVLGKKISFHRTSGIIALKLLSEDDPDSRNDDAILTIFGLNNHQLVYNVSTKQVKTFGKKGKGDETNILFYPQDVAADKYGNVYISDTYNFRILKLRYDSLSDSLIFISQFGEYGNDSFEVNLPSMMDLDSDGNLYISDSGNNRIMVLDSILKPLKILKNIPNPGGIAIIDKKKKWCSIREKAFIVVVSESRKLLKLTLRGEIIAEQFAHNVTGFENVSFNAIDYDYHGNVWVTDKLNSVIHKFDKNLKYIISFGGEGFSKNQFYKPAGISIFRKFGQVFIVEETGFQYYWIGVDGWIESITPSTVNDSTPAITISLYTTEQCRVSIRITKDNKEIRKLTKYLRRTIGMNHIIWDLKDNDGNDIVEKGEYKIEIILEALYSSRGFFEKKVEAFFEKI